MKINTMGLTSGSSKPSWEPEMTVNSTTPSYWLNWRVLLCTIWLLSCMVLASALIWRHEGSKNSKQNREETQEKSKGVLYADEVWKPSIKEIHPAWLLAYRVLAFFVLLVLLIANVVVDGGAIFYYYTHIGKSSALHEQGAVRQAAGTWGYVFQIIFQMSAGAVMLTDFVFWFIIVPLLAIRDYNLTVLLVGMHSVNAVFLLGDAALNCLRFPWFRMAYFVLWTAIFVVFQWIVHACVSIWWPYPFLDLSSSYAPVWYNSVGLMHVPCYSIFALAIRMKHVLWSKWFPQSYQCVR